MVILEHIRTVVTWLITLSILVIAHEWGHFIVARLFGIRVDDFSIGFGKRLIRIAKRGDTEYNIRMLPLGGFVKIAGMDPDEEPLIRAKDKILNKAGKDDPNAAEMPLIAENVAEHDEDSNLLVAPDGFNAKPIWQRSLVIIAGPAMSFILGYLIFCLVGVTVGLPNGKTLTRVAEVEPGGVGQKMGLRTGDEIKAINGVPLRDGLQMVDTIHHSLGRPVTLTVLRNGETLKMTGTPQTLKDPMTGQIRYQVSVVSPQGEWAKLGLKSGDQILGVGDTEISSAQDVTDALKSVHGNKVEIIVHRGSEFKPIDLKGTVSAAALANPPQFTAAELGMLKFSPAAAHIRVSLRESFDYGTRITGVFFKVLGSLFQKKGELQKNAGGVILMYQETGRAAKGGADQVLMMMAQLSLGLAIFNLMPIPVLDGGHLLTFFIEWIRRGKKMTEQQQQNFMLAGLMIIGVLFVLIMTNDILRTVHHNVPQ